MQGLVLIVAVVIGLCRPFLPTHPVSPGGSYEAMAHLFVGGLIGAWFVSRQRWLLYTVIALSGLEVLCAIASKLH